MNGRALVTGIAAVAPTGSDVDACWSATLAGKTAIDRISRFDPSQYPITLAAEIRDDGPSDRVPGPLRAQTDRMSHFALTAAEMALEDSGAHLEELPEYGLAVVVSNSAGGTEFGQRELQKLRREGPMHVGAYMAVAWFYAASTGQISIRHRMRGPCGVLAGEQAGGLDAVAHARRQLRRGATLAVTGGSDAPLSPAGLVAQMTTGLLSRATDPVAAYRPFDVRAGGYVPGEGGAMLVLETPESARARGVHPYAEVAGHAATFDPPPGSDRPPALQRALELALADARVRPEEVDAVFADGYAVPELDRREAAAIAAVFGAGGVPVTVPKTTTGRLYAGGGPLDLVFALLSMRDGVLPPTVGVTERAATCPIDLVADEPRELAVRCAVVLARGYAGLAYGHPSANSAVVVRAC